MEYGIMNTNMWQEIKEQTPITTYVNTEQPLIIHVVNSGWDEPKMYSVIVENGDLGYPSLEFLTSEEITNKFNIKLKQ